MLSRRLFSAAIVVLALLAIAGGCSRRRTVRRVVVGSGGEQPQGVPVGGGAQTARGSPEEQLQQLDSLLRSQGYQAVGPPLRAALPMNGVTAYSVDVRRGQCYTIAVFGTPEADFNLVMLDPAGRVIAHDVRPDEHPWVNFCAARGGRFVARVQVARGQGEYLFAPYVGPGRRQVDLTAFFGGTASAGPQLAAIDAETQARLQQLDRSMMSEQYWRVGEPSGLVLGEREERFFEVSVEQGRCYAFATLGGPGTTDTDVFLQDGLGQSIQADTRTDRDALVRYCSPATGNYTLRVRNYGRPGPVFTVAYLQAVGGAVPTDNPVIANTSTAGGGLDESFALLDADMRARGYESFGEPQRNRLPENGEQTYAIEFEAGRCYAILAVGDSGVRDMSLSLLDRNGNVVDRDEAGNVRPTVRVCPRASGQYMMQVRMVSGGGQYVYAPYRWPRGTRLGDLTGIGYVRLAEVTALLQVEGFAPDPGYDMGRGRLRREGATASHTFQLRGGQCYAIVVVGGEGVRDLDVTLAQDGREIANDFGTRNAFPNVRHCATADGSYTVTVRAASGSGEYVYQIFSQSGGTT
jgi:hypothetical protein